MDARVEVEVVEYRGWEVVRLRTAEIEVDVVPGKGGDILAARWRATGLDVLWKTRWGLRHPDALPLGGNDESRLMQAYPGGWQTVFPNGGDAVEEHGVTWATHGEVWSTPFEWEVSAAGVLEMSARLVHSPFQITKSIALDGPRVTVREVVTNLGGQPVEVMWSHHPAFGAPFLSTGLEVTTNARTVLVDDIRDNASSELVAGATVAWPHVPARRGGTTDLATVPAADAGVDRMAYLTDFPPQARVRLANPEVGVSVTLDWRAGSFPFAWYWLEAGGTGGFPWYHAAYVLAVEPATSYPAQGLHAAQAKTGTQVRIAPGESRSAALSLTLGPA